MAGRNPPSLGGGGSQVIARAIDGEGNNWRILAQKTIGSIEFSFGQVKYNLIVSKQNKPLNLGNVVLCIYEKKDSIRIESLDNSTHDPKIKKSAIKGIGSAALEVAFRVSCLVGKGGKIELFPINDASVFYFTWGFRFHPDENTNIKDEILQKLILTYLTVPDIDKEEMEKKIRCFSYFSDKDLQRYASLVLGRAPHDFKETLEYGYLDNKDALMSLLIRHNQIPRNGVNLPSFFLRTMYFPTDAIEQKMKEYSLL